MSLWFDAIKPSAKCIKLDIITTQLIAPIIFKKINDFKSIFILNVVLGNEYFSIVQFLFGFVHAHRLLTFSHDEDKAES